MKLLAYASLTAIASALQLNVKSQEVTPIEDNDLP